MKTALIGLGRIGWGYHRPQILAHKGFEFTAVVDPSQERLDEAKALDCDLSVEVILSDDDIPVPKQVRLAGEISPYARQTLTNFMVQQLGIEREEMIWT